MKIGNSTYKNILFCLSLTIAFLACSTGLYASEGNALETDLVHQMMLLVFQLAVIIFAAKLGGMIFKRLNLPELLGELMTGAIIGPYLLGGISLPGFPKGIFPLYHADFPVSPELYAFTTVASIVLLFLVGLETDLETFLTFSIAGTTVGIGGVTISFLFGNLTMVWFSPIILGTQYHFADPVPLFMGVICTATSVGITARILSEKRKMDSIEGVTILSGAVIDDVLGIIVLAIVLGISKSGHMEWGHVAWISAKAFGVWLGFTALGIIFSNQISHFLKLFKDKQVISVMGLALALLLSGVFEQAGLAMIIGAYIMGLSLSKTDLSLLIQENLSVLNKFLVPVFFCVMGMLIDFHEMFSIKALVLGLIYTFFAVVGKILGCSLPSLFLNFNVRGALRVGVGMIPRGEVALIIAGIGLSSGILPHDIFSISIIMTFLTTVITPPVFSKMLEIDKPVLKKERKIKKNYQKVVYDMPNIESAELILTKVIQEFEQDGFYVHRYDIADGVYQIMKEETIISMHYMVNKISFDCQEEDITFVHTVFYEVIADLEKLMKNLRQVTDKEKVGKKIFENTRLNIVPIQTKMPDLLSAKSVAIHLQGNSKEEIIPEMVQLLVRSGKIKETDAPDIIKDIMTRESTMSTGMQQGIALPHSRSSFVNEMMCAVGIKKEGLDFKSLDKKPACLVVLTLTPTDSTKSYLKFLSEVSRFLLDPDIHNLIMHAQTDDELYQIFTTVRENYDELLKREKITIPSS